MDWFARLGLILIVVVLIGLILYSRSKRPPTVYGHTEDSAPIESAE